LPGRVVDETAAVGAGADCSGLDDAPLLADAALLAGWLGRDWVPGAAPAPLQAVMTAQPTAATAAAARARHRFLARCTPRL
jgi:hypothetical protein